MSDINYNTYFGEVNGTKFKYENDKLYRLLERHKGGFKKKPSWKETKGTLQKNARTREGKTGYYVIYSCGKNYYIHRVIYQCVNKMWDIKDNGCSNQVDHIDGDKSHNKIANLRILNASQNQQNSLHYVKGYYFCKTKNKYIAVIRVGDKQHYLGQYLTPEAAREAYLAGKKIWHPI